MADIGHVPSIGDYELQRYDPVPSQPGERGGEGEEGERRGEMREIYRKGVEVKGRERGKASWTLIHYKLIPLTYPTSLSTL